MTSRSRYVKHWFDIKVLSVRILLKVAWELTHRYFIFVFSWGSILSFRFDLGNYSNRILTLLQLYDEVSERSSLRSIQLHIAESQQRHDSNKNFNKNQLVFLFVAVADSSDVFLKCFFISEVFFTSGTDMVWQFKFGC
jgi:hypothetical protein